jgi:anaerobic selenocysteine-containing dehydrogenase
MGANQSTVGTLKNRALINLCLATGQIGRPGSGPLSLTGQPNAMGGRETGGLSHLLPGYRKVTEAADRAAMAEHWKIDVDTMSANIQSIIDQERKLNPPPAIVLVGMRAPPNLGPDYARRFRAAFPALAEKNAIPLVPFLLDGVAGRPSLNQGDMIHPTAQGQRIMAETVWRVVGPVLRGDG